MFSQLSSQGKLRQLEMLIQRDKSKLQVVDKKGRGLLHHAARHGHENIMGFVIEQGIGKLVSLADN